MKDRVVQFPNRYRLTHVSGDIYDLTPEPGIVTEPGTDINKATLLKDETATLYGLGADAVPDEVFEKLSGAGPWRLLQTYTTAGAFNWTAPDIHNGQPYEIGVYEIGGGGSGAAYAVNANCCVSGGAAGYAKNFTMTVTPGASYPVVVGAGGAAVSFVSYGSADGNAGGSTSFSGITVSGGGGGKKGASYAPGADGGQGSDQAGKTNTPAPAMGMATYGSGSAPGGLSQFSGAINLFNMKRYLAAGGGASGTSSPSAQTGQTVDDGSGKGGDAAVTTGTTATAQSGTGYGNGGGAVIVRSASEPTGTTSGAGAPGAVLIYARGYGL